MADYLGIDTSNYTTSAAIYRVDGSIVHQKKLLPVKHGALGLRQSEAVFHHVQRLPEVISALLTKESSLQIAAVGATKQPRDEDGSYMPCFTVGLSTGRVVSELFNVPFYEFSHQCGHIAAALYSVGKLELLQRPFLAFHVSGGTTEALLVTSDPDRIIRCELLAKTLDLHAGQVIDRVGKMLGLPFPAGPELEKLATSVKDTIRIKICLKNGNCCLSGFENQCRSMKDKNEPDHRIARYCIEAISQTLDMMCENLLQQYGDLPIVFAGGVTSNQIIKERLSQKYGAVFASSEFSSDNAAGIAVLTALKAGGI